MSPAVAARTFGPAYDPARDGQRLATQLDRILGFMRDGRWRTLAEIRSALGYPEASVSAQLRHLRRPRFGSYVVEKRRRMESGGTWEYRVLAPPPDPQLWFSTVGQ